MGENREGFQTTLNPEPHQERSSRRLYSLLRSLDRSIRWAVEVKPEKRTRSARQNAYLWGVVYRTIEAETGQSSEDWHDYFLGTVYGWDRVEFTNPETGEVETFQRPLRRSSRLKVGEFAEYVDRVIEIAAGYGIQIPFPNEDLTRGGE